MNKLKNRNIIGAAAMFLLLVAVLSAVYYKEGNNTGEMTYIDFMANVEHGSVDEVILTDGAKIKFTLIDSDTLFLTDNPRNPQLKESLLQRNIAVSEGSYVTTYSIIQSLVSTVFLVGAFYFVYRSTGRNNMKSVMALNPSDAAGGDKKSMGFEDIAGNEEAKESVADIVDFIRNPEKYAKYGARMPRGVIFYGPPGTGKTLMAKAIATEAGVPFFAVSGSDFVQMYVGVGAGRIRELFSKAREQKKAVVFIDEIDALGKTRGTAIGGGNDERDQTLNALLTEMSGFGSSDGIVVIAATNRLDTLDEALLRPGRFDRQIEIGLPDLNARKRIIALHAKDKPLSDAVVLDKLARQTVYFSGAMLENLLNEAAIFAAKRGMSAIEQEDVDRAYYTVVAGSEKKDRSNIKETERRITATHEAGHALMAKLVSPENTVSKLTIIPSTKGAGGFCINIPPDKMFYTKQELESQIMVNFAGRAAEEIIFGPEHVTTGAGNDIEKASALVKDYVVKYGMGSKTGLLNVSVFKHYTSAMEECSEILQRLYSETKTIIERNASLLQEIAEELLSRETLQEEDLDRIINEN